MKKTKPKTVKRNNKKPDSKVQVIEPEELSANDIREDLFVKSFLKEFNGTNAIVDAGYTNNKNSARVMAVRMLTRVSVQDKMKKEVERIYRGRNVQLDKLVDQMEKIAFCDIKDFLSFSDTGVKFKDSEQVDGRMIQSVTSVTTEIKGVKRTTLKLQLWDKLKALEMLGRHLAMFTDVTPNGITDPAKITNVTVNIHQKVINNN